MLMLPVRVNRKAIETFHLHVHTIKRRTDASLRKSRAERRIYLTFLSVWTRAFRLVENGAAGVSDVCLFQAGTTFDKYKRIRALRANKESTARYPII